MSRFGLREIGCEEFNALASRYKLVLPPTLMDAVVQADRVNFSLSNIKEKLMRKIGDAVAEIFETFETDAEKETNDRYRRFHEYYINKFTGDKIVLFDVNANWQNGQSHPQAQSHKIDASIESQFILEVVSLMDEKFNKFTLALVLDPNYYVYYCLGHIKCGVLDQWEIRSGNGIVYLEPPKRLI